MAILGSQTTNDGDVPVDVRYAPTSAWRWTVSDTYFLVEEANASDTHFDGGPSKEAISTDAQTADIGGVATQLLWDDTFQVTDNAGNFWRVGVIGVNLDNSHLIETRTANGYHLVFPDGFRPRRYRFDQYSDHRK